MRKLSELLRISTQYHSLWNPSIASRGMCAAAGVAQLTGAMLRSEAEAVMLECMRLVTEVDEESTYLSTALYGLLDKDSQFPPSAKKVREMVVQAYEAWIDKLESEGR